MFTKTLSFDAQYADAIKFPCPSEVRTHLNGGSYYTPVGQAKTDKGYEGGDFDGIDGCGRRVAVTAIHEENGVPGDDNKREPDMD